MISCTLVSPPTSGAGGASIAPARLERGTFVDVNRYVYACWNPTRIAAPQANGKRHLSSYPAAPRSNSCCSNPLSSASIWMNSISSSIMTAKAERSYCLRCQRPQRTRSEEHTSELQSRENLVCRLLLEKKNEPGRRDQHAELLTPHQ